jgi:hypothetical protein
MMQFFTEVMLYGLKQLGHRQSNNALQTWNDKLSEIWSLVTQSPETFKGGGIWRVIVDINGALQAVGLALLVLFFVAGVVKTAGILTVLTPDLQGICWLKSVSPLLLQLNVLDKVKLILSPVQKHHQTKWSVSGFGSEVHYVMPYAPELNQLRCSAIPSINLATRCGLKWLKSVDQIYLIHMNWPCVNLMHDLAFRTYRHWSPSSVVCIRASTNGPA